MLSSSCSCRVEAAELEVVLGHFGMQAEVGVGHVGGAGLGGCACAFDGAADAAPEVGLPSSLALEGEVVVAGDVSPGTKSGRLAETCCAVKPGPGGERGIKAARAICDLVARGEVGFEAPAETLVHGGDALFELVELGIVVDLPPLALIMPSEGEAGCQPPPAGLGGGTVTVEAPVSL